MESMTILFALMIFGTVVLIFYLRSKERRKKLAAYAESQGWRFSPDKNKRLSAQYPGLKCLHRGHSRFAKNIMQGQRSTRDITAFDYHYATGHGKSRRDYNFSALILSSPLTLQSLYIRPEHIFDKISDFFGYDDIDFESAEFSRAFYIKAPEKSWAYQVIHPQMMAFLLESPKFHVQFSVSDIIVWRNKRFQERDFDAAFDLIQGLLERIPTYIGKPQVKAWDQSNR